jgi:hypothetical protein
MSQLNFQPPRRAKDDPLTLGLEQLGQAVAADVPGREREWTQAVRDALARVEAALRQHRAAAKTPEGPLAEVEKTNVTITVDQDKIRQDEEKAKEKVREIGHNVKERTGAGSEKR